MPLAKYCTSLSLVLSTAIPIIKPSVNVVFPDKLDATFPPALLNEKIEQLQGQFEGADEKNKSKLQNKIECLKLLLN